MKKEKEIKDNIKGTEKKLKEFSNNIKANGWEENLNAKQTEAYMKGWVNALKWLFQI